VCTLFQVDKLRFTKIRRGAFPKTGRLPGGIAIKNSHLKSVTFGISGGYFSDRQKTAFLLYCVCRGDHWSPANLPQQRIFWDSFLTRQTGAGEQCSPLQEFFDSLKM
jgi:hypothetical protein